MAMITTLVYWFLNCFVFQRFIMDNADNYQIEHKCNRAISFYNIAYKYYSLNHLSAENKENYFEIPYKLSICYLEKENQQEASMIMSKSTTSIQKQYGFYSQENAYFIRKYLIEYYLANNDYLSAKQEFETLLNIYRSIGYDKNILIDLECLNGDLSFQQGNYDEAMSYYQDAYSEMLKSKVIDYDLFGKITERICDYLVKNNDVNDAISVYTPSITVLTSAENKHQSLTANLLIKLGDLYNQGDPSLKNAINCYEKAIDIIKKLPRTNYLRRNIITYLTTLKNWYNQNTEFHKADQIQTEIGRESQFSFLP